MKIREKKKCEELIYAATQPASEDWETSAGSRGKSFTTTRTGRSG